VISSEGGYPQHFFISDGQVCPRSDTMVFFDNSPLHPSMLLNNILCQYLDREEVLKIILVKEKLSSSSQVIGLENSFYCEVVLTKVEEPLSYKMVEVANQKINLKDQLDTKLIVENAADLNLKLMKWR
jgi:hypothetical protein